MKLTLLVISALVLFELNGVESSGSGQSLCQDELSSCARAAAYCKSDRLKVTLSRNCKKTCGYCSGAPKPKKSDWNRWNNGGDDEDDDSSEITPPTRTPTNNYPNNNYPYNGYPNNNYPYNGYPNNNYPYNGYPNYNSNPNNGYPYYDPNNAGGYPQNNYPNPNYPQNNYPNSNSPSNQQCVDKSNACYYWNRNGFCLSDFFDQQVKQDRCARTCGYC